MSKVFIPAYWPIFKTGELRRFDYTAVDGSMPPITAVFSYDKGSDSMLYIDYDAHLTWKDTWYYRYNVGSGINEWRDDYPGKKIVMSPPIGWGEWQDIGSDFICYPKMNPLQSWPPAMAKGIQICHYEKLLSSWSYPLITSMSTAVQTATYNDVLVFTYLQSWDGKPGTGARYWMANGVGPVSVQWLAQDPKDPYGKPIIETARMDAVVTRVNASDLNA
jgi:hypothetical protein